MITTIYQCLEFKLKSKQLTFEEDGRGPCIIVVGSKIKTEISSNNLVIK